MGHHFDRRAPHNRLKRQGQAPNFSPTAVFTTWNTAENGPQPTSPGKFTHAYRILFWRSTSIGCGNMRAQALYTTLSNICINHITILGSDVTTSSVTPSSASNTLLNQILTSTSITQPSTSPSTTSTSSTSTSALQQSTPTPAPVQPAATTPLLVCFVRSHMVVITLTNSIGEHAPNNCRTVHLYSYICITGQFYC